jgi:hypothetical protein
LATGKIIFAQKPEGKATAATDTASVLRLIKEGSLLTDKNPDEALRFFLVAEAQSRQSGYTKGMALANAKIARWYFGNNSDKAIEYSRKALLHFGGGNDENTDEKADVHLLLAETFDEQGKQDSSAYYYYLLGNEVGAGNISDGKLAVDLYTKLLIFWMNLDYTGGDNTDYLKTMKGYVDKAKLAAASIRDSAEAVSSVYFMEGAYFHALKSFDSARYYYKLYLKERERINKISLPRKISVFTNIADTYLQDMKEYFKLGEKVAVHTAGAVSKNVLQDVSSNYGVLYPLQSLNKNIEAPASIPFLIDGNNQHTVSVLSQLAKDLSDEVNTANDEERLRLHVAAVFVNNFTNHLYEVAAEYCEKEKVNFNLLRPLIVETAQRILTHSPASVQTGPAKRNDVFTLQKHLQLLANHAKQKYLYMKLTDSIINR